MSEVVLDASALLALLNKEPGHEEVAETIPDAAISAVNLSSTALRLAKVFGTSPEFWLNAQLVLDLPRTISDEKGIAEVGRIGPVLR